MMPRVDVWPDQLERARILALRVRDAVAGRPNYDGLSGSAFKRYFVGYVGEFAVANWLSGNGVGYRHRIRTDGRSHGTEFIGRKWRMEVKGLSHWRDDFVIGEKRKLDADYFVVARSHCPFVDAGIFEIVGWYHSATVRDAPANTRHHNSATRTISLKKASEPQELLELLDART